MQVYRCISNAVYREYDVAQSQQGVYGCPRQPINTVDK